MQLSWCISDAQHGMKLVDYLRQEKHFSRRLFKVLKTDGGSILVNGVQQTSRYQLSVGDNVACYFPDEKKGSSLIAETMPLDILFEDESVLVLVKPAGMATIPSRDHPNGTLANGILAHYERQGLANTIHIVTRLDRDTSGLVLVAKHRYAHAMLSAAQKAGEVNRAYTAIVEGFIEQHKGTIDLPIGRKEGSIIERTVTSQGKPAVTHFQKMDELAGHTVLDVRLETGRTHQIRVHFSHLGHPLAGDVLYGGVSTFLNRQALHCKELSFVHPFTNESLVFHSDLPADLLDFSNQNS